MIGVVIVSHSATLAEGVRELAGQMAHGQVSVAVAGGIDDPENPLGTDAVKVLQAIESVYSADGVLVLMDLGSALLSAETALEFLPEEQRAHVYLCPAPLVEGAVAAVVQILAGSPLDQVISAAQEALAPKVVQLGESTPSAPPPLSQGEGRGEGAPAQVNQQSAASSQQRDLLLTLRNPLGLHARPAVQLVRTAARFDAQVYVRNVTAQTAAVDARSINRVLGLGARNGHQLALTAQGREAEQALAGLAALIESGFGETISPPPQAEGLAPLPQGGSRGEGLSPQASERILTGIPASPGIAIGVLGSLYPLPVQITERQVDDPQAEWRRLQEAITAARAEIRSLADLTRARLGADEAAIFEAHLLFLDDPELLTAVRHQVIEGQVNAEFAWQTAIEDQAAVLRNLSDPYLRTRALDLLDVGQRVLRHLAGGIPPRTEGAGQGEGAPRSSILVAHDLTPSQIAQLDPTRVLGLALAIGSPTAHSAILARALGIPLVVGLGPEVTDLAEGTRVALDGGRGLLWVAPGEETLADLASQRESWLAARRAALAEASRLAMTRDGHRVILKANISGLAEAQRALEYGAEGVGLLRTEFLFQDRTEPPSEEEQMAAYRAIAEALGGRPLAIRTFDIGGDKPVPYVEIGPEPNPFLGWRGIRIGLDRPELLKTQLRAILRASPGQHLEILFPMIATLVELREVKAILIKAQDELRQAGIAYEAVPIGVMIELPAAVVVVEQLAAEVDFLSVGTNDLAQYVMAADRTNSRVAALADALQPAVLRLIAQVAQAGLRAGVRVSVCGELAGEPLAIPILLGLGLTELSMAPPAIPAVKQAIARLSLAQAQALSAEVLALDSAAAVREYLADV